MSSFPFIPYHLEAMPEEEPVTIEAVEAETAMEAVEARTEAAADEAAMETSEGRMETSETTSTETSETTSTEAAETTSMEAAKASVEASSSPKTTSVGGGERHGRQAERQSRRSDDLAKHGTNLSIRRPVPGRRP